jgi:hypothetical protein
MSSEDSDSENPFVEIDIENPNDEPEFSSHEFLWKMYGLYVNAYILKCAQINAKPDDLMQPGVFCVYLSIRTLQAVKNTKPFINATLAEVIQELSTPNVRWDKDPCGPIGHMKIFADDEGDAPPILDWEY